MKMRRRRNFFGTFRGFPCVLGAFLATKKRTEVESLGFCPKMNQTWTNFFKQGPVKKHSWNCLKEILIAVR